MYLRYLLQSWLSNDVAARLWGSEIPTWIISEFLNSFFSFVKTKPMHDELWGLNHVQTFQVGSIHKICKVFVISRFCYHTAKLTHQVFWEIIKGALSGLRQFLATESSLKMMKNNFYFTLKALSVLKIFKFLFWVFGHV